MILRRLYVFFKETLAKSVRSGICLHQDKVAAFPRVATSLDELWKQIQKAWDEIDLEQVRDLIDEMEQRRVAVWKAKGKSTKY